MSNTIPTALYMQSGKHNIDRADLDLLNPFLLTLDPNQLVKIVRLHGSHWTGKSYLIEVRSGAGIEGGELFLKAFPGEKRKYCGQEIHNLNYATAVAQLIGSSNVLIPKVIWVDPASGLLAFQWIPGRDLSAAIKGSTRWWSFEPSPSFYEEIQALLNWLMHFAETGANYSKPFQTIELDSKDWDHWLYWLRHADHIDRAWRLDYAGRLEKLKTKISGSTQHFYTFHGDFTHWNVRQDLQGNLWVLDWSLLDTGHWLEAAYRFYHALKISGRSPLARTGSYETILTEVDNYLQNLEPDEELHLFYRVRAIMQYFFSQCRRPAKGLWQKYIQNYWQRYWMHELVKCMEGS